MVHSYVLSHSTNGSSEEGPLFLLVVLDSELLKGLKNDNGLGRSEVLHEGGDVVFGVGELANIVNVVLDVPSGSSNSFTGWETLLSSLESTIDEEEASKTFNDVSIMVSFLKDLDSSIKSEGSLVLLSNAFKKSTDVNALESVDLHHTSSDLSNLGFFGLGSSEKSDEC